jgi:hypothetical protein
MIAKYIGCPDVRIIEISFCRSFETFHTTFCRKVWQKVLSFAANSFAKFCFTIHFLSVFQSILKIQATYGLLIDAHRMLVSSILIEIQAKSESKNETFRNNYRKFQQNFQQSIRQNVLPKQKVQKKSLV